MLRTRNECHWWGLQGKELQRLNRVSLKAKNQISPFSSDSVKGRVCPGVPWTKKSGGTLSRRYRLQLRRSWKAISTDVSSFWWRKNNRSLGPAVCYPQVESSHFRLIITILSRAYLINCYFLKLSTGALVRSWRNWRGPGQHEYEESGRLSTRENRLPSDLCHLVERHILHECRLADWNDCASKYQVTIVLFFKLHRANDIGPQILIVSPDIV